jgi:PadR family transcriptional regulator PadR
VARGVCERDHAAGAGRAPLSICDVLPYLASHRRNALQMSDSNWLSQTDELVLRAVALQDNAYAVSIRREIAERSGRNLSFGAVYNALERLQEKGYVSPRMGEPTPERGGRAKRYFRIEAPGKRALNESREAIERLGGLVHVG